MLLKSVFLIFLCLTLFLEVTENTTYPVYASSCNSESATRVCNQGSNVTEYLLSIKKGGTNVLSALDYDTNFFECE
jgi:hypothetical protein